MKLHQVISLVPALVLTANAAATTIQFDGDCNYDAVVAAAGVNDLTEWFDDDEVEDSIEALCQSARDKNSNPRKGACE